MKVIRLTAGMSLVTLIGLGLGCSKQTVVVPTDQKAIEAAQAPPPPPIGFGGGPETKETGTPSKVNLKGIK